MSANKSERSYFICPQCFHHFYLKGDYKEGGFCPVCLKGNYLPKDLPRMERVYPQKCVNLIAASGEICGGNKLVFRSISICTKCGRRIFYLGVSANRRWVGKVTRIFKDIKEIDLALFQLQKQGEVMIFQDVDPFNKKDIHYFVWLIP